MNTYLIRVLSGLFFLSLILVNPTFSQKNKRKKKSKSIALQTVTYDTAFYAGLKYRSIGPFRGGRSAAVTGVPGKPRTFFMGATGGGIWKTTDSGNSWKNISDGYFGGSVGAVAVSESDPNVIYVGGGEVTVRGNVSSGYGMWKSDNGGKTWKSVGLKDSKHIPRVRIHPKNPDLVYAAVLGHLYGPNKERGVYRSKDGGKNWEQVLFVNDKAGAVDLILDPNNPRIIYASTWRVKRTPYSLESGGEGSGLWRSTDGGDNWENISSKNGLPKGTLGIIGVTVSPVNSERIWAMIEAKAGGLYRSDDGGENWKKVNDERKLRQRAWYYTRVYADTKDEDKVYVVNVRFHRSKDGGKSFEAISTPHGDHHDLWIDPNESNRMVIADDGGGQVTVDGGKSWSTYRNQPTAQFYRVTTDNHFPYRIYAAQQDNSTVRISHRTTGWGITDRDWESTAGGESGHIAPDPKNPDIVYAGSYDGLLTRVNHATNERRVIDVWPDNPMGWGAKKLKYRFQWNFPIFFSPNDPNTLYCAANVLFKTTNEGQSWEAISPDLTRNDSTTMESSGGPITKDNTSVEYYGTIFAAVESNHEAGVIWTGSDDGLIHVTKDGGANWENVTPPTSLLPEWTMINSIDINPFEKGGLYVAATAYKKDDFRPYLYKTSDYGKTWKKITNGIKNDHFTRVVRADPKRKGLLYAGTETGMYVSFDDGESWQPFQNNLPVVPITDLAIKDNDLIVATQGRSLWVMDDLTPLHQLNNEIVAKNYQLFTPRETYRMGGAVGGDGAGKNPPSGVILNYYLKDTIGISKNVTLEILDGKGELIKKFDVAPNEKEMKKNLQLGKLKIKKGMNQFSWDMRYADATTFPGMILWFRNLRGPRAVPGTYKARLTVKGESQEVEFVIKKNPNSASSEKDLKAQFDFLSEVRDKVTETHDGIAKIREIRKAVTSYKQKLDTAKHKDIITLGNDINKKITKIEEALYQTQNRSPQDPLNFPVRLNNKLSILLSLVSVGDYKPTDQAFEVKNELVKHIDAELGKLKEVLNQDIPAYNKAVKEAEILAIDLEEEQEVK